MSLFEETTDLTEHVTKIEERQMAMKFSDKNSSGTLVDSEKENCGIISFYP